MVGAGTTRSVKAAGARCSQHRPLKRSVWHLAHSRARLSRRRCPHPPTSGTGVMTGGTEPLAQRPALARPPLSAQRHPASGSVRQHDGSQCLCATAPSGSAVPHLAPVKYGRARAVNGSCSRSATHLARPAGDATRPSMTCTENSYLHRAGRTGPGGLRRWPGVAGGGLLAERRLLASAPRRKVSPPSGPFAGIRTVRKNREVGESPTRARHCDRGTLSRCATGLPAWEGGRERRSGSQETGLADR